MCIRDRNTNTFTKAQLLEMFNDGTGFDFAYTCSKNVGSKTAASSTASADAIRDANRLLRVTDLGSRFESMALDQTRMIIRTYASIVNMNVSITLPQSVKNSIAECYAEAYAWKQFEPGIAKIFAEKGIHIICDKPLALSSEEAISLKNIVESKKLIFALTHNYTGYPMVRHARSLIQKGDLGSIRVIQAEYPSRLVDYKS